METTRRALLKNGLMVVSAGMAMPAIFSRGVASAQQYAQQGVKVSLEAQGRTLIVVQLAGGNDGLNTVVPYVDATYRKLRPTIGIAEEKVLHLDERVGLHPSMAALKSYWDKGQLAIVEGVGYPDQSLSHFQAMDIWQTIDLQGHGREGWLGKLVAGMVDKDGHPFTALDIGTQTARALSSLTAPVPTLTNSKTYRIAPDPLSKNSKARTQTLTQLYNTYPATAPYAALFNATANQAQKGTAQLVQADASYKPAVTYPMDTFSAGLQLLAEAVVQNLGLRIGYITLGGFDTHANQQTTHSNLLKTLSEGVSAFYRDLEAQGKADNVVIMTWSEFGRRVGENGSLGTDHGTAAPLFVMGRAVKNGLYGAPSELQKLDSHGNLNYTTDFRAVYATLLDRWMGASSQDVLGGSFTPLPFFK